MPLINESLLNYEFPPNPKFYQRNDPVSERLKDIEKDKETKRKYVQLQADQHLLDKISQEAEKEKEIIYKSLIGRMSSEVMEANNECKFIKPKEAELMRRKHYQQEEDIAFALSQSKLEKEARLKARQNMYESTNSDKLRKLKQQLNLAYIAKENAAQRRETQVLKAIEKHDEASVAKVLRDYRNFQIQVDKAVETEKRIQKVEELQRQQQVIVCNEKTKQRSYENELTNRELLEGAEMISWQEDFQVLEKKKKSYLSYRDVEKNSVISQNIWKEYENNLNKELEENIKKYSREKYLLEEQRQLLEHQVQEKRALTHERLSRSLYEDSMKALEKEEVLLAYHANKYELETLAKEKAKADLELKIRNELIESARRQRLEREARAAKVKEEEHAYALELAQQAIRDKKRIEDEKRTHKEAALKNIATLNEQVAEKRLRRYEDMVIEAKILEIQTQGDQQRIEAENDECRLLLIKHGSEICDYIPPGMISREDIPLLGEKAQARFKK